MAVTGVKQTTDANGRSHRAHSRRLFAFVALLAVTGLTALGYIRRDALRETWLALQPIESLRLLDARDEPDALTHFVYASRLAGTEGGAKAWPPAARAAAATPTSARDEFAGRVWSLAGCLAAQYGDSRQAEIYLEAAARLRPTDPAIPLGQGILSLRRKETASAIAALTLAARQDPLRVLAWTQLGSAYLLAAEPEQAEDAFRRAVKLAPTDPQAHAQLAEALGRLARHAEAAAECRTAAGLAPDAPEYSTLPALSSAASARTDAEYGEAVHMLNSAIARFPDADLLHALLAGLHARFNRYDLARHEIEIFLSRSPKDSTSWLNLATICERLGDTRGAATANARYRWIIDAEAMAARLKQQALLHPADAMVYLKLAAALERSGKMREAVAALVHASELRPDDPDISRQLAAAKATLSAAGDAAERSRDGEGSR